MPWGRILACIVVAAVIVFSFGVKWYATSVAESARKFEWFFTSMGQDHLRRPVVEVAVKTGADVRAIANFAGKCASTEGTAWHRAANELASVVCVYGSDGKEIGIFYESGRYIVRVGDLQGIEGDAALKRGDFKDIFEII